MASLKTAVKSDDTSPRLANRWRSSSGRATLTSSHCDTARHNKFGQVAWMSLVKIDHSRHRWFRDGPRQSDFQPGSIRCELLAPAVRGGKPNGPIKACPVMGWHTRSRPGWPGAHLFRRSNLRGRTSTLDARVVCRRRWVDVAGHHGPRYSEIPANRQVVVRCMSSAHPGFQSCGERIGERTEVGGIIHRYQSGKTIWLAN